MLQHISGCNANTDNHCSRQVSVMDSDRPGKSGSALRPFQNQQLAGLVSSHSLSVLSAPPGPPLPPEEHKCCSEGLGITILASIFNRMHMHAGAVSRYGILSCGPVVMEAASLLLPAERRWRCHQGKRPAAASPAASPLKRCS